MNAAASIKAMLQSRDSADPQPPRGAATASSSTLAKGIINENG
ncbi:hypothetical protein [Sphingomonas phyllosphaerae]